MKRIMYFWTSEWVRSQHLLDNPKAQNYCIVDGREMPYDVCSETEDAYPLLGDKQLVGCGEFSKQLRTK